MSSRARSSGAGMEQGPRRPITVCQPTELSVGSTAGATDIWRYSVGYGEKNNGAPDSTTLSLPGGGTALMRYGYDGLDRLTLAIENYGLSVLPGTCQANQGTRCQQFTHDALGNRAFGSKWNAALPGVAVTKFSSSNRIDQKDWIYDQRGNLTQVPKPAGLTDVFLFDVENRVEGVCSGVLAGSACSATSQNVKYGYDADGRRVTKEAGGRLTVFVYDALGRLAVEDGAAPSSEAAPVILTADHLGSTRLVTKKTSLASGDPSYLSSVVVERRDYMPFGDEISFSSGDPRSGVSGYGVDVTTSRKFTGKERDAETGLDFFQARYYSAAQGRFTSPDEFKGGVVDPFTGQQVGQPGPLPYADITNPQSLNKYAYVLNNPLRYTDPDGHETDEEKARRAAQGAAASVGTQATQDAAARAAYHKGLQALQGAPRGDPAASAARTALKIDARAASSPTGAAIAEAMRPIANEAARVGGTASKSNAAVDAAMGVAGKAGPALMVVGAGVSAYNVATSDNPSRALAQEGGSWAGALALGGAGGAWGAKAGAAIGAWFGGAGAVPGAAIGGVVGAVGGGIAGAIGGEKLATKVYDWLH